MKKICSILGARPQFIKAGPLSIQLRKYCKEVIIHTGQHYDFEMSGIFFEDLSIPEPDYNLNIGSGSHGVQTGAMLAEIEQILINEKPDAAIVYGDTNSTLSGALAAVKLHIPVAHIEAGMRSFNNKMPEEINRVLTDHISHWLFVPSEVSRKNLENEGITGNVHVVGDIMYDAVTLFSEKGDYISQLLQKLNIDSPYYLATIHPASTVSIHSVS